MTTLWERFKFAVATDMDALLTKKEEKNPLALLNRYINEAAQQTAATGNLLERQMKVSKELEKEFAEAAMMLEKRQRQLELASQSQEEDLARFAEKEVAAYKQRVAELEKGLAENQTEIAMLEQKYEEMKHKVKDMKIRQLRLMGKENSTRAHRQMDTVLHPERAEEGLVSYEDMESYIQKLGKHVEDKHEQNVLAKRLEELEKNSTQQEEIV